MQSVAAIRPSPNGEAPVAATGLSGLQLLLIGLACAVCVANNYYSQPLLIDIARDLGMPAAMQGVAPMLTQIGIAAGMLLLLPLGDRIDNRSVAVSLLTVQAAALVAMSITTLAGVYYIAAFVAGVCGIVTYMLPAFATRFVPQNQRGSVTGMLAMGIMLGIMAGRSLAGIIGYEIGWRGVFAVSSVATLTMAAVMKRVMPLTPELSSQPYGVLLSSLAPMYRQIPLLRIASFLQMLSFGVFTSLWVGLALRLQASPFFLDTRDIGMLSLVAIVGAIAAPALGRLADRYCLKTALIVSFLLTTMGWSATLIFPEGYSGVVAAIVLVGVGATGSDIALRGALYRMDPGIRMRLNSIYSGATFLGGSLFSFLTPILWTHGTWLAVAGFSFVAVLLGLLVLRLPIPSER